MEAAYTRTRRGVAMASSVGLLNDGESSYSGERRGVAYGALARARLAPAAGVTNGVASLRAAWVGSRASSLWPHQVPSPSAHRAVRATDSGNRTATASSSAIGV